MNKQVQGFVHFVREQGVVGLAVGLVLGVAVKSLVDSMVNNLVNPIIGLALGGVDLNNKYACLKHAWDGSCSNKFAWGPFIGDLIKFMVIAAVVYYVVHGLKLDRLDRKKEDK